MSDDDSPPPSSETQRRPRIRRPIVLAGIGAAVVVAAAALVWFQPHKLFVDNKVDEAFPEVVRSDTTPASVESTVPTSEPQDGVEVPSTVAVPTTPAGPVVLVEGEFASIDHETTGRAFVADLDDGSQVLRLEDLSTDNGPDLFVYLSAAPVSDGEQALDDDIVDLGRLKGNVGSQNYTLPSGVDLSRYRTVVIWCKRFSSGFGAADLA